MREEEAPGLNEETHVAVLRDITVDVEKVRHPFQSSGMQPAFFGLAAAAQARSTGTEAFPAARKSLYWPPTARHTYSVYGHAADCRSRTQTMPIFRNNRLRSGERSIKLCF